MTYTPTIYDWRLRVCPAASVFRAGGQSVAGGMTVGGVSVESPEPGGRATLDLTFNNLPPDAMVDASWTYSRAMNGAVFKIPLYQSVQLISDADADTPASGALLWDGDIYWSGPIAWRYDPYVDVRGAFSKGASSIKLGIDPYGQVFQNGHVIGISVDGYEFAHIIMDIQYDAAFPNQPTVQISPPLRRDVVNNTKVRLRPYMLATCSNPESLAAPFVYGKFSSPGVARFVEALI